MMPTHIKTYVLLSVIVSLFLLGCTPSKNSLYRSNEDFWDGIEGLVFDFVDENPPDTVYEETPFQIALEIANEGAHIMNGYMTLSIEEDYMCIIDDTKECTEYNGMDAVSIATKEKIENYQKEIDEHVETLSSVTDETETQAIENAIMDLREKIEDAKHLAPDLSKYKTQWFTLEGKSIFNYVGGSDILEYNAKAKTAGQLNEKHDVTVVATACYEYTTKWNQEVCIDTDINKMNIFPGACEATDISLTSQGAPLAITRIESSMLPTSDGYIRPMFTLYVENKGTGKVINADKTEHACTSTGLSSRDYNMVFLSNVRLSNDDLVYTFNGYDPGTGKERTVSSDHDTITCSPNPLILDNDGDDYVMCIVNDDVQWEMFSIEQAPYSATLSVQFDYGYTLSTSTAVTIERLSQ